MGSLAGPVGQGGFQEGSDPLYLQRGDRLMERQARLKRDVRFSYKSVSRT